MSRAVSEAKGSLWKLTAPSLASLTFPEPVPRAPSTHHSDHSLHSLQSPDDSSYPGPRPLPTMSSLKPATPHSAPTLIPNVP